MDLKKLAIVIVNYNVREFLEQALISVQDAISNIDAEVFVVDNNSADGSCQMVKNKFPWVSLIENKENLGFSGANNQAIRISNAEYVLLLNPDTLVEENTFEKCVDFMDEHQDAGALGVKMINGDGDFLSESKRSLPTPKVAFYKIFGFAKLFPKSSTFGKYHLTYLSKNKNHEVEVLSGAFMLLRKSVLDKIGLLDESFFMYGEDIDLSYRVILAGYKNYYFSNTQIIHYKGESTKKGSLNYVFVFYNAMLIFAKKHFSKKNKQLFTLLIRFAIYFRASLAILRRLYTRFSFPFLEFLLSYVSIFSIKNYWETNHRWVDYYPDTFDFVANPIYSLIFVLMLWFFGAYKKPYKLQPIINSAFFGFVSIAIFSYVFSQFNFSRAIVFLGSISVFILTLFNRLVLNFRRTGKFHLNETKDISLLLVGNEEELERTIELLNDKLFYPCNISGLIVIGKTEKAALKNYPILGKLTQIEEVIPMFNIEEVIFCSAEVSSNQVISTMALIKEKFHQIKFKLVPPKANFIVGPQEIHSIYTKKGLLLNLNERNKRIQKRVFDFGMSLFLILLYPLTFFLYQKPLETFKNLLRVLAGKAHLVGYACEETSNLPKIKHGLLDMTHSVKKASDSSLIRKNLKNLDNHYAKYYTVFMDLEILLKGFKYLGN